MVIPIYDHIKANRRRTFFLFSGFALLFLAVGYALGVMFGEPAVGLAMALVLAVIIFFISYTNGQNIVAQMANARPVDREEEPYLYHTIDGLSIAAGIPTPQAYIIETEVPNAFAAGRKPGQAAVAVTRGLLNRLDRSELEGVIAHEIAHIKNYDVLLATMAVVLAGTIVLAGAMVRRSLWFGRVGGRRRGGKGQGQALVLLLAVIMALLAPLFARVLQYAISREREYLADASGAELTGYPEGLASALEKISGRQVEEGPLNLEGLQGLFIVNPAVRLSRNQSHILATHPPIEERVKRLREM